MDEPGEVQRVELLMRGATPIGRFHRYDADPPSAELFEVLTDRDSVIDQLLSDLPGWNLTTTDEALAVALVERGAIPTRHFSLMTVELAATDMLWEGAPTLEPYDIETLTTDSLIPKDVVGLVRSAYPVGHPDVELGSDEDITRDIQHALDGVRLGSLMEASALVFDGDRLAALVLVNRVPGQAPVGGPWITDICRDQHPKYAGLGRALLVRVLAMCRAAGESSVSLAVTEGNTARQIYDALGFTLVATTRKVRLPG